MDRDTKKKVIELFDELLPWEKQEVLYVLNSSVRGDYDLDSLAKALGVSKFEFISEEECVKNFDNDDLLREMDEWTVVDFAKDVCTWEPHEVAELITWHSDHLIQSNIDCISNAVKKLEEKKREKDKEKENEKSE